MTHKNTRISVLIAFGLSGVAALIYEVIWVRMLGLVFGNTVYAISTVLAVFFAGLALGSLIFGKIVDKQNKPLFLYGLVELGIGAYAVFTPWIFQLIGRLQESLGVAETFGLAEWSTLRFALSFGALIIPSVFIGGTLPIIVKYFAENLNRLGNITAKLYSLNTFGAVLGTTVAGFFLVGWLGVRGSIYFAAVINIAIGLMAIYLWQKEGATKVTRSTHSMNSGLRYDPKLFLILAGFFLSGFAALALEVLWTRALILTIGISTYAFSIVLITFLLGIALGSIAVSRFVDKINAWNTFGVFETLKGVLVISLTPVFAVLPLWYLSIIGGFGWSFAAGVSVSFLLTIFVLLLPTLFMGASFPVVAKILSREFEKLGLSIGRAYLFNTLGGVAGSLVAGFFFIPFLGLQKSMVFAAALYLLLGVVVLGVSPTLSSPKKLFVLGISIAALGIGILLPDWNRAFLQSGVFASAPNYAEMTSDQIKTDLGQTNLVFYKEGISSLVSVEELGDELLLRINGKTQSGSTADLEPHLLLGHLPALLHTHPRKALVFGLGSGITVGALTRYSEIEEITALELEPEVVEAAQYFSPFNNDALGDARVNIAVGDGRNYLLTSKKTFDIITSEPSNPWIRGMANLYTQEFFMLAKDRLSPGGIMVQWMQINSLDKKDLRSFVATFQSVFPDVLLWETADSILLVGSEQQISLDLDSLNARAGAEAVQKDLARMGIREAVELFRYFGLGSTEIEKFVGETKRLHTDNNPFLEFSSPKSFYRETEVLASNIEELLSLRGAPLSLFKKLDAEDEEEIQKQFDFQSHFLTAEAALLKGELTEAGAAYEKAHQFNAAYTPLKSRLKLVYGTLGRRERLRENYPAAEMWYLKLASIFPEDYSVWVALGIFYASQGRVDEALEAYNKSLFINPDQDEIKKIIENLSANSD